MSDKFSSRFQRFKRFYHRNDTVFACIGLVVGMHIVWWQIQQNKNFVPKHERIRKLGPIPVIYLDEIGKDISPQSSSKSSQEKK